MSLNNTRKSSGTASTHVLSREGRYLGVRHVMYCPDTKMYVSGSCTSTTPDRIWAWSGTMAQANRARDVFGIGDEYLLFRDGEEKSGG